MPVHDGPCDVSNYPNFDLHHNSSIDNKFCAEKSRLNDNRKNLARDRHGIQLEAHIKTANGFDFNFQKKKGKYLIKISPEQLRLHKFSVTFDFVITNTRQDPMYLTSVELLHSSKYFDIHLQDQIGQEEGTFAEIATGGEFKFSIVFKTDTFAYASYKIPLICNFQTTDNKYSFTIYRAFLVYVDSLVEKVEDKVKSPFTSKRWKDIQRIVPAKSKWSYVNHYPIPREYRRLLAHCLEPFDRMTAQEENDLQKLKQWVQQLTKDNYNMFWHVLLWLDEMGQFLMLMKYNMQEVTMKTKDDTKLVLEVPGLAEKRPSVIVGDSIKIRLSEDHTVYMGLVTRVHDKTIEISHVDDELLECLTLYPDTSLDVSFMLNKLSYERAHAAVDKLVHTGMVNNLFPENAILGSSPTVHDLQDSQFINTSVCGNHEQRNAVNKILNSVSSLPYIVFGPPGTGKTVTIVEAILQIKKRTKKKILVCAPANAACDMLAMKLKDHCTPADLLRIHSETRDRTTIPEELKLYSNIDDDVFVRIEASTLPQYRIIVTTLVLVGKYARSYRPDCVFIDEAAQATEPESAIALSLLTSGKQVVLAGDHKQLGPVTTKSAEKFGLGTSLLERLMSCNVYQPHPQTNLYDSNYVTMLILNFRSHPSILSIPNKLFYNNLLKPMSVAAQQDPIVKFAFYQAMKKKFNKQLDGHATEFCSVSAKERREGTSPSYFNLPESKMVVECVRILLQFPLAEPFTVKEDQIGVVTPYQRQVFKIKDGLKYNGFMGVEVGTTETFQGREKRIIIISTVRAQHSLLLHDKKYNLGFVKHDRRFNVAVTRAISKLIIIGNPLVLRTDSKWQEYMDLCEEKKTFFGIKFPKDDQTFRKDVVRRMKHFKDKDDQYHRSS